MFFRRYFFISFFYKLFVGWYMEVFLIRKRKGNSKGFWFKNKKRVNYLNFSMTKVRVIFYSI